MHAHHPPTHTPPRRHTLPSCAQLRETSLRALPASHLHLLRATLDPEEAFGGADFIFHAVPMQATRAALQDVQANGPGAMGKYKNDPEITSVIKELQEIMG